MSEVSNDIVEMGYRSIHFTLKNQSGVALYLDEYNFVHGRWDGDIPYTIEIGETVFFKVCSRDAALYGVEGTLKWKVRDSSSYTSFTLYFKKPYGSGDTIVTFECSDEAYKCEVCGEKGGHDSNLTLKIQK